MAAAGGGGARHEALPLNTSTPKAEPLPEAVKARPRRRERPEGLPHGFGVRPGGVYVEDEGKDGTKEWRWLCSPLRVLAFTRDADGLGWGRLVELTDADGRAKRWAIPAALFAGDGTDVRRGLLDRGLRMASGSKARHRLHDLLMGWTPAARATITERLGWTDETCSAFALGSGAVLGAENVVYQLESAPAAAGEMKARGTFEGWRDGVAAVCTRNPIVVTAVSLAFAGPLLEPLQVDGGGLHLRGMSSCGKSTAQKAAVSVWGSPRFLFTWRATSNGLEAVATAANATLLALDELGEISGRDAGEAVYMLANGQAKARMNKAVTARPRATWRVPILSSGEIALADKLAEAGQRAKAGQDVRLLDIAADGFEHGAFRALHGAPDAATFSDRVRNAAAEHYGHAGPQFVQALIEGGEEVLAEVRAAVAAFRNRAAERFGFDGSEGQVARAVQRLAVIAAAGEMAKALGLTGWPEGEAHDAALDVLGRWLEGRGDAGAAEAREAIERTRAFIEAHGPSRFERVDGAAGQPTVWNRVGWCDGRTFFTPSAWKEG